MKPTVTPTFDEIHASVARASISIRFADAGAREELCAAAAAAMFEDMRHGIRQPNIRNPRAYLFIAARRRLLRLLQNEARHVDKIIGEPCSARMPRHPPLLAAGKQRDRVREYLKNAIHRASAWEGEQAELVISTLRAVEYTLIGER